MEWWIWWIKSKIALSTISTNICKHNWYWITFKIKNGYSLELLRPETKKLLGSTKNKITADINGENVPHLEITKAVLVHCNIVNNDYQQDSRILYTFVPNKPFGSLLEISPANHIFLKMFNSEF